jgi:hypothetical protein
VHHPPGLSAVEAGTSDLLMDEIPIAYCAKKDGGIMADTIAEVIERWRVKHMDDDQSASNREEMLDWLMFDLVEFVKMNGFTEADLSAELDGDVRTWVETEYARTVNP